MKLKDLVKLMEWPLWWRMFSAEYNRRWKGVLLLSLGLLFPIDAASAGVVALSSHTMVVGVDGRLSASGPNMYGQLGVGDIFTRRTFCPPQGTGLWLDVWAGPRATFAKMADGSLWGCGSPDFGMLGVGEPPPGDGRSFLRLGTDTDWSDVSVGERHGIGRKTNGSLWVWGYGPSGQLGLGLGSSNQSSPIQLGTDAGWVGFDAGNSHNLAIKADGSLWSWGQSFYGQLGIGVSGNCYTPVRIGALAGWAKVSAGDTHSLAIRSDGTLWAWGANGSGRLGIGTTASTNVPVKVGTDTDWLAVSAGYAHSLALKTDGSLWAWGNNSSGQLGVGDTVNRLSPVRVGTANDWQSVNAGNIHSAAVRSGGAVWLWGSNEGGELGVSGGNRLEPAAVFFAPTPDISVSTAATPTYEGQLAVSGQHTYTFPSTTEGSPTSANFTIFNHGSSTLQISDVRTGPGFSAGLAVPATLAPGGSAVFPVTLDATRAGLLSESLILSSNDPDEAAFLINLTGRVYSFTADNDGDGLSDAGEVKLAAMGFRWDAPDPGLLAVLRAEGHRAGLMTEAGLHAAHQGGPLFKQNEVTRKATFGLRLEKSTDLSDFIGAGITGASVDGGGRLLVPQPLVGQKSFFRFATQPPLSTP